MAAKRGPQDVTLRGFLKHFAPDEFRPAEITPWACDEYSAAGRTILTKYIITMAKGGERDAKWLADSAALYLSQQKLCRKPPEVI
jgi:hypothetical protein